METNDLKADALLKIEKLKELADDIEKNGQNGGDTTQRQLIISGLTHTDNEEFFKLSDELFFKEDTSDMTKTIIAGLYLQKKEVRVLGDYINTKLNQELVLDKKFEDNESLLLIAEVLCEEIKQKQEEVHPEVLEALTKLFIAACSAKSTVSIADKLLSRFINVLPNKSKLIDNMLIELLKNKELEINPKLISIDILGRSNPSEFYPVLEDIIINTPDYSTNHKEVFFLLDVCTKILSALTSKGYNLDFRPAINKLNSLEFKIPVPNEQVIKMKNRIQSRLKSINSDLNSRN